MATNDAIYSYGPLRQDGLSPLMLGPPSVSAAVTAELNKSLEWAITKMLRCIGAVRQWLESYEHSCILLTLRQIIAGEKFLGPRPARVRDRTVSGLFLDLPSLFLSHGATTRRL